MANKRPDWFKGIFPALVTPFTASDEVDEETYRALIRFVLPHVNGVVPCGTTGEFSSMTLEEKMQAIEICLDEVGGRVPVLAGTGCQSTRETLAHHTPGRGVRNMVNQFFVCENSPRCIASATMLRKISSSGWS